MSSAAYKRKKRARDALLRAILWARACGIKREEIKALFNTERVW
jgi:hypothetical protein